MKASKWNVPFQTQFMPSIELIPSGRVANSVDLIVYPEGSLDKYPAYLAKFDHVPAYRSYYEGMHPNSFSHPMPGDDGCAFVVENSPWVSEFSEVSGYILSSFGKPYKELKHFIVIGGDHVVEVLSFSCQIEKIDAPKVLREIKV